MKLENRDLVCSTRQSIDINCLAFRLPMRAPEHEHHRSGWQFVMRHLCLHNDPSGILLDDFIERSFQRPGRRQQWLEPWVGIFHHPPNLPVWLDPTAPPQAIFNVPQFLASLPHLQGAIALSEHLARWLRRTLRRPVLVRKHPTEIPSKHFSIERWHAEPRQKLVQIGWYARNQRAIYQVDVPKNFRKVHLLQDRHWVARAIKLTDEFSPHRNRPISGPVDVMREVDDEQYDDVLASSLVFNEYWDVSASNAVIEAIARSTPLVINRHPALVEYLGTSYPLFFYHISEVKEMLADTARIRAAWEYLRTMDKRWLCANRFAEDVIGFVRSVSQKL